MEMGPKGSREKRPIARRNCQIARKIGQTSRNIENFTRRSVQQIRVLERCFRVFGQIARTHEQEFRAEAHQRLASI
jgi:hypothetical protein